ncbi:MAG: hypothetical protein WCT25_00270 [Candidatus Paceibacterota bacterium]
MSATDRHFGLFASMAAIMWLASAAIESARLNEPTPISKTLTNPVADTMPVVRVRIPIVRDIISAV